MVTDEGTIPKAVISKLGDGESVDDVTLVLYGRDRLRNLKTGFSDLIGDV
jgi:hypothetical protein